MRTFRMHWAGWVVIAAAVLLLDLLAIQHVDHEARPVGVADAVNGKPNCGIATTKPDGTPWVCTFADNFNGNTLNLNNWLRQIGYPNGSQETWSCSLADIHNVSVANGALRLTTRKNSAKFWCPTMKKYTTYSSGWISTFQRFSQAYGKFEFRAMSPASDVPGLQEAFWLWPDSKYQKIDWPRTGEIDVMELYSLKPHIGIPYLHYRADDNGGYREGVNSARNCRAERGTWNTYTLVWTPTRMEISINGVTCLVNISGDVAFTKPYYINLTSALGQAANSPTKDTPLPATTYVDYVRVWK